MYLKRDGDFLSRRERGRVKAEPSKFSASTSLTSALSQWERERKASAARPRHPLRGTPGLFLSCSWLYKERTDAYLAQPMSFYAQNGRLCMVPRPPRPRTWLRRPQLGGTLHHGRSDDERCQSIYFHTGKPHRRGAQDVQGQECELYFGKASWDTPRACGVCRLNRCRYRPAKRR
jgi:hypothetical protein